VGKIMVDPKKSAEAARRIQEINRTIQNHQSRISTIEREKAEKVKYYDQQIRHEQDEIKRYTRQIDELKRQI
jgi:DNA repair ATPase RecN